MPGPFADRILAHLAHSAYRPSTIRTILSQMQVPDEDREAFEADVQYLEEQESLVVSSDERLRLPQYGDEATGTIKINQRGFAFVRPDQLTREGDLYIPRGDTRCLLYTSPSPRD